MMRGLSVVLIALACMLCGCGGYTSEYVPPSDGRARALWRETNVVFNPGTTPGNDCEQAVGQLISGRTLSSGYLVRRVDSGYWAPRYYGLDLVVINAGIPPLPPRPPLFLPPLRLHSVPAPAPVVHGGGGGGFHLSGGGDGGKLLAVIAIIVLVVLPAVDLGLALARPESENAASIVIDRVNAYNDLLRNSDSPCSYDAPAGGVP